MSQVTYLVKLAKKDVDKFCIGSSANTFSIAPDNFQKGVCVCNHAFHAEYDDCEMLVQEIQRINGAQLYLRFSSIESGIATIWYCSGKDDTMTIQTDDDILFTADINSAEWKKAFKREVSTQAKLEILHIRGITEVLEDPEYPDLQDSLLYDDYTSGTMFSKVIVGAEVQCIDGGYFNNYSRFDRLECFEVEEGNPYYCDIDGILYSKDKKQLIQYPSGRLEKQYAVPQTVDTIGTCAFLGCGKLEKIHLPDSVIDIKAGAFMGCSNIKISASKGSYAEAYANKSKIPFSEE